MAILVTGGAGYIGSHTVAELVAMKEEVIVVDNLVTGHRRDVQPSALFYEGDIRDKELLSRIFEENEVEGVIHFAAYSQVGESMKNPHKYYDNNVYGTSVLLDTMMKHGVSNIVFSSSAAVYGEPNETPITEFHPTIPTNCYGATKLAVESMMEWYNAAYGLNYIALRYFNAAGAHPTLQLGEKHSPETHLIPIVLDVASGKRDFLSIFGDDYETSDGTCIRDYVHVTDLATAHIRAYIACVTGAGNRTYNLGTGVGYSVKDIIRGVERITGQIIDSRITARREGDPSILVASYHNIKMELGWEPRYGLDDIIETAWKNHNKT